jgi:hypothetical protein
MIFERRQRNPVVGAFSAFASSLVQNSAWAPAAVPVGAGGSSFARIAFSDLIRGLSGKRSHSIVSRRSSTRIVLSSSLRSGVISRIMKGGGRSANWLSVMPEYLATRSSDARFHPE